MMGHRHASNGKTAQGWPMPAFLEPHSILRRKKLTRPRRRARKTCATRARRASRIINEVSMSLFEKGMKKTGGRAKGTRNKISEKFLQDLHAEWDAHGAETLKIMRVEEPGNFVKVVAAILPKEFEITQTQLMEIP